MRAIVESIFSALGPVLPERVPAGMFGQVQAMAISGQDPRTGRPFIHFTPYAGGWGARAGKDGVNALCALANGDNYNVPCEVIEAEFPLLVERYELIQDSGGPGTHRGGLGVRTDLRVLSDGAIVSASLDRYRFPPPGRFGGAPGHGSSLLLGLGEQGQVDRPKTSGFWVKKGGVISHRTGGGGGFGDPRLRDPRRLADDIDDGYVSPDSAARDYAGADEASRGGASGPGSSSSSS
jgi:N-methylhydantoinase B